MRVVLIACSKKKKRGVHAAADLYDSPLFRLAFIYAILERFDLRFILSAKYGLLEPRRPIRSYNRALSKMSKKGRRKWVCEVAGGLREIVPKGSEICILTGEDYRKELTTELAGYYEFKVPMQGLSLGNQIRWLNAQITRHR